MSACAGSSLDARVGQLPTQATLQHIMLLARSKGGTEQMQLMERHPEGERPKGGTTFMAPRVGVGVTRIWRHQGCGPQKIPFRIDESTYRDLCTPGNDGPWGSGSTSRIDGWYGLGQAGKKYMGREIPDRWL